MEDSSPEENNGADAPEQKTKKPSGKQNHEFVPISLPWSYATKSS